MAAVQISGRRRKKESYASNLRKVLQEKVRILRIEAPLGIVGIPGTGRKTLAYRFANMNRDVIQDGEVPSEYFYTATFRGRFTEEQQQHPANHYERFALRIIVYIIEPPAELPPHDPPLYLARWNDFCCLLFVFDVRNQASFHEASMKLTSYRQGNYFLPRCFLVGNKCDRRYELPPPTEDLNDPEYVNQRPVSEITACIEACHLDAVYFECSGRNNIDVGRLLLLVKMCAMDRKYWIRENED